ncbi:tetratricopeptide repeat protein [Reichenbachiella versicolor]|uniref:tetratricopeptide repeat protein n=1 Tax=Reichenbachiella versicolor TaxID=1821036 RepID=UPI000D6E165B|nr:hypothetical protein [Reichenbachiella versicolor]
MHNSISKLIVVLASLIFFALTEKGVANHFEVTLNIDNSIDSDESLNMRLQSVNRSSNQGDYNQAFDQAMQLKSELYHSTNLEARIDLLFNIVFLYLIFEQDEKARDEFYSVNDVLFSNIQSHKDSTKLLRKFYRIQGRLEMEAGNNYPKAEEFILKGIRISEELPKSNISLYYDQLNLAELYIKMYRLDEAEVILKSLESRFDNSPKHINDLLFYNKGIFYLKKQKTDSAILYLEKSLSRLNERDVHFDIKVKILEHLEKLYTEKGNVQKAYQCLSEAKAMSDQAFNIKSPSNNSFLEIRDRNAEKIRIQQTELLKNEKDLLRLRLILYIGTLVVLILVILFYFIKRLRKTETEKKNLEQRQETEKQMQKDKLEQKNKELLSSAMQLIERDSLQEEVKKHLDSMQFKKENEPTIQKIINSLKIDRSKKWEEFDVHFTALNHKFFSTLKEQFPELTKTDLKICAFINLGFSSKDMAQIMGLGVDGINTSRSRLRKKMGLSRDVVLIDFLNEFSK